MFTIIIPVYNAEQTIERTLASFISNKDYIHEVILVNDRCTDDTFSKIEPFNKFFRIRLLNNFGKGAGAARKTGLLFAKSEWVTFVDADDCLTPNSLYYVREQLYDEDVVLLHTQTIYYESGSFSPESIGHSDTSCGGNFYRTRYLFENDLYPHDTLPMSEDEYFNEKVINHINYCDTSGVEIRYFDYPVYEVHHDVDEYGLSFALRNWADYCCRYHLLYKQYITSDFIDNDWMYDVLLSGYLNNFIFCYYLSQGLMLDAEIDFDIEDSYIYFKNALTYFVDTFNKDVKYLINYYYENKEITDELLQSAIVSIGFTFDRIIEFSDFIEELWRD